MASTTSKGGEALGGLTVGTLSKFPHTQEPTTADLEKGSELSCEGWVKLTAPDLFLLPQ